MTILIGEGVIPIHAKDETAAGVAEAKRRLDGLKATAKLDADISAAEKKIRMAEAWLTKLGTQKSSPQVDVDTAKAMSDLRIAKAELEYLGRKRTQMKVSADTAQARSGIRGLGQEATSADNQVKRLSNSGRGLGSAFASAARGPAILMAIASAAGIAGAAVAAVPAALASLSGIGGVLLGSLSGVGEALKGYQADQDAASAAGVRSANSAASSGRAIRDASKSINDARRNQARVARDSAQQIEDAERNQARVAADAARSISDAKADQARTARDGAEAVEAAADRVSDALGREKDAQESLNDAFESAANHLQDLRDQQNGYALDAESASIRVAREEAQLQAVLADSNSTTLDIREARNQLAQAKEREAEVTRRATRSAQELAEAERAGLNGSDEVVAARKRLQDAQDGTRDAQEALARTTRDASEANVAAARRVSDAVRDGAQAEQDAARQTQRVREQAAQASEDAAMAVSQALQGLADAQAQQAEGAATAALATSKYADAMAKLTPEGQAFVRQLISMKPLVDGLSRTSQQSFLPGLTDMLRDSEGLFPIFNGFLRDTGTIMGGTAREAGQLFKNPEFKKDLTDLLNSSLPITQAIGDGMVKLTEKTIDFGAKMAPASAGFATFIDDTVEGWTGMYAEMEPYADDFKVLWEEVGGFMKIVLPLVGRVAGEVARVLGPALAGLNDFLESNNDQLDDWIFMLGGAYLALKAFKGLNLLADLGNIASGMLTIGTNADGTTGKVSKLTGKLRGLKTIGKIGITFAAAYVGFELIQGLMDGGVGKERLDTDKNGKVGTGERWQSLKNFDFQGIGSTMADDIKKNPFLPEGMNANPFVMPTPPPELKRKWDDFFGGLGQRASKFATDNNLTWTQIKDNATGRASELTSGVSGWWGRTFTNSDSTFANIRTSIGDKMTGARNWASERAGGLYNGVSGWWGRTFSNSDSTFNSVRNTIGEKMQGARNWATERAGSLQSGVAGWWGRTFTNSDSTFARIRNTIGDHMQGARDRASRWASDAYNGVTGWFGRMWQRLKDLGRDGVNGVIRALNWLSDKGNIVLRFLHVPTIPGIPMLAQGGTLGPQMLAQGGRVGGGFVTNGPQTIVGEGRSAYPEYVVPTDPAYRTRALDLFASLGGQLGQTTRPLMLAEGGILGWLGDTARRTWGGITGAAGAIGSKLSDAMSWLSDMGGSLSGEVLGAVRNMLPSEPWRGMGAGVAGSIFGGIKKKIDDSMMSSFDPGGTGVQRWAPLVLRALGMMGQPASLLNVVLRRMNQESGGNPMAINNWDINAKRGDPSRGLMQTIMSTFRAYHFPGTSMNIYDPLANILASMRYAMSRYGSLAAAYNRKGGYSLGGRIPGTTFEDRVPILAQSGERVLSRNQNDLFERFVAVMEANGMDSVLSNTMSNSKGDTNVYIQQTSGSPAETARLVSLGLR